MAFASRLASDALTPAGPLCPAAGLVEQSERVAEEGEVDASMALAAQAEALKGEHDKLLATLTAPDRIMSVCEVCRRVHQLAQHVRLQPRQSRCAACSSASTTRRHGRIQPWQRSNQMLFPEFVGVSAGRTVIESSQMIPQVCGVFINSTDNEQRRAAGLAHATGSAPPAPPTPAPVRCPTAWSLHTFFAPACMHATRTLPLLPACLLWVQRPPSAVHAAFATV